MAYFTRPDYSRQLKQYSGTSAVFSGTTNILQAFYVKSIEIDTAGAILGDALLYDAGNNKFRPGFPGSFSGSVISNGFLLSYYTGLTYSVGAGSYNVNGTIYTHNFEYITISSGQSSGSRFDLVYVTAGSPTVFIREGVTTTNPTVPNLQLGELEVGIISVPANFTGGTGSTTIQTTADTVFVYYNNGAGTGIQRAAGGSNSAGAGDFSFATGVNSRAYGYNSNALGYDTKASGYAQTVVGQYNVGNTTDYFIVGYGADDSNRANAFNVTNLGDTYANKRLFVTNVEIETTGATSGQVLKFNGSKFTPQFESITGLTLLTGGTNFISSITSNSLLVKALTGSTGITITETDGLITLGLNFSGTNAITDIVSLTGGTSIISGKTGTTFFLYPIEGAGGTSVTLVNGKITVYSDSSGSTTGQNIGGAVPVFAGKSVNELQFRTLSSLTPSNLTIQQVGDLVLFSASSSSTTIVTLFEDVSYSQLTDKITGSTLQIGKQYRITSGRINEGGGTFGYVIVNAIDTNKISKNGTLITLNPDYYNGGNYTDVAVTPLGSSGIAYSGQPLAINETAIYNNNHYKVTAVTTFNNTLTNLSLLSRDFVNDYGYILANDYIEYDFTSDTITKRVDSIGNTVEGKSSIDVFQWGRKNQVLNNRVINNSVAEIMNFRGIISGNTFDNNARLVSSFDDTNFILDNTNIRNNVLISAATFTNTQFRNCDISTDFGLVNRTLSNYNFVSKLVTSDVNQLETNLNIPSNTLDLTNFNHFGVFNISAASSTFSINAIQNYNQTYKLTFKPLVGYLFNFVHSSTIRNELEDTHPIDGNYDEIITYQKRSKAGTVFYQENINTFKALSALTTSTITDIASVDTIGAKSLIEDVSSASTTGRTATFRALVEGTNITIDDTSAPGYLIINSTGSGGTGSTSFTGITDIISAGTGNFSVISSVTNNKLVYRTISAGTGINITESNGTLVFVSTATGSTSGGSMTGTYVSGVTSAGTGNILLLSGTVVNNNLVQKTLSAGTNIGITDDGNGTIIISGSGGISGNFLPISGGTLTGGLSANTISATTYYNLPTYDNEIHVSGVDGSDTTGNGELLNPVATITKALTLTTGSRKTIIVHPGGYSESPTVTSGNTTISTSELTGANTVLYGTLTIGTLGSGSRISGLKMSNLVISGTAQAYISNCTVDTQVTKSSSGFVEIINTEMQCSSGIQIAGSGTTIINGNKNAGISVSNSLAQVIIKGCNSVVTPSASAGNLAIVDCIVTALGGNAITITNSATTLTLINSQVLVQAGNYVAPISVAGIYSIINTIYDKPNSTFAGGTSTNSIDYFQYINADGLTIKNGTGNADSSTNLLEGQNTAGSVTSFMRADGTISGLTFLGDASNLTGVLSKTLLTANIPVTSQAAQVNTFYLYDKITITSVTSSETVTAITSDVSISAYTPSIKFFANTGVTVTFRNSATLKTEGGLDAVIVGSNYDSITFTYNNNIQKYFQTNINNYI
jgi:hypothetical protein